MLKVENIHIAGFEPALRGMRNPKDSWERSDTVFPRMPHPQNSNEYPEFFEKYNLKDLLKLDKENIYYNGFTAYQFDNDPKNTIYFNPVLNQYVFYSNNHLYHTQLNRDSKVVAESHIITTDNVALIGPNDLKLMKSLCKGGPVHSKFARMIVVWMDVTASFDFWKEYDTMKVGTVANSCSTMHRITKNPISIDNFSTADLRPKDIEFIENSIKYYQSVLNDDSLDDVTKTRILSKINLTGFEQKRTLMLNYEVIHNACNWRRNHKLEEWRYLSNEIFMNLPYFRTMFYEEENKVSEKPSVEGQK